MNKAIKPAPGWGYQQIGWLLEEVCNAGADIPAYYFSEDNSPDSLFDARKARLDLGQSISMAFTFESLHGKFNSAGEKKRLKDCISLYGQLKSALSTLEKDTGLKALLSDRVVTDTLRSQTQCDCRTNVGSKECDCENRIGFNEIFKGIEQLRDAASTLRADLSDSVPLQDMDMTKQNVLIDGLAKAYRERLGLGLEMGSSRAASGYGAPFEAFVRSAYALARRPPKTDEALTKAVKDWWKVWSRDKTRFLS